MPLLGLSLFLGFYPKPVLDRLQPSVDALVTQVDSHSNHQQAGGQLRVRGVPAPTRNGRYTISVHDYAAREHRAGSRSR